jgi:hypothetical protein
MRQTPQNRLLIDGKCRCISMNSWNHCDFSVRIQQYLFLRHSITTIRSSATCILNCSKISFTVTASSNTDFCPCQSNFTWDITNQKCDCKSPNNILNEIDRTCLPNCSDIGHTDNISYPRWQLCLCWPLCLELHHRDLQRSLFYGQ